jgi:hypothetical protein
LLHTYTRLQKYMDKGREFDWRLIILWNRQVIDLLLTYIMQFFMPFRMTYHSSALVIFFCYFSIRTQKTPKFGGAKVYGQNGLNPVSTRKNVQKNLKKFMWIHLWKWRRLAEETKFPSHHIIEISKPHFTRKKRGFHFKNPYLPTGDVHKFYCMII